MTRNMWLVVWFYSLIFLFPIATFDSERFGSLKVLLGLIVIILISGAFWQTLLNLKRS